MDGGFKKHGHGCLWLLARLLPTSLPISLVKYAFSLSRKTKPYADRAGRPPQRPTKLITVQPFGCPVTESGYFEFCLRQKIRIRCYIYTLARTLQQVQSPGLNYYQN